MIRGFPTKAAGLTLILPIVSSCYGPLDWFDSPRLEGQPIPPPIVPATQTPTPTPTPTFSETWWMSWTRTARIMYLSYPATAGAQNLVYLARRRGSCLNPSDCRPLKTGSCVRPPELCRWVRAGCVSFDSYIGANCPETRGRRRPDLFVATLTVL